ncbi:MAG: outer membrane protein assembly factor BamB [Chlamydiales bacterium]|jgi:outer membrane protein assembly factor BamB
MLNLTAPLFLTLLGPLAGLPSTPSVSDDFSWPQWDGPQLNGISREKAWASEGQEANLWELPVGMGYSAVAVQDGRLYTMGYDKDGGVDIIWCVDAMTGEERWTQSYPCKIWDLAHPGGTVNTPSIDGDVVYTLNREGNLYCFDGESGDIKWHTMLMPEDNIYELEYPRWGFSAAPLVLDDALIINCGRVISIDKKTGEVQWVSEDYGHAYGTATPFEFEGEQLIAVLNLRGVGIVRIEDGEQAYFHEFAGTGRGVNAATPIVIDDAIFVSSGTIPAGALLAFGDGEMVPVWQNREMANSFSGCVRMGDHLYGFDQSELKCIDLEGESKWSVRGIGNGAVTGAGDRILAMGATGELIIAQASAEQYKELSRVQVFDDDASYWTKPILVNGIIYCRSSKGSLVARDHRQTSDKE